MIHKLLIIHVDKENFTFATNDFSFFAVNGRKEELLMKHKELKEKAEFLKRQLKAAEIANGVIQVGK